MSYGAEFATTASLLGDPVRAAMLSALLNGRAMAAGELAYAGRITAQTASSHLAQLVAGGLLTSETEGRHRYFRLAGPHVAEAIEKLSAIQPIGPVRRKAMTKEAKALQGARRCYDHLAGQLGVAVTHSLVDQGHLRPENDRLFAVTEAGVAWFARLGVDPAQLPATRRGLARQCLDWTERAHHLGGPLGVALLRAFCDHGWLRGSRESRAVEVTPRGRIELRRCLGIDTAHLTQQGLADTLQAPCAIEAARAHGHPSSAEAA